ncbi:MAG: DUF2993 domain-containing protein [Nodosilinea sp.]
MNHKSEPYLSPEQTSSARGSRLIARFLPPAIRLWLHSQIDNLEGLDFGIMGQDRQILSGYLPQIALSAREATYQGLRVRHVQIVARDIYLNLGQVLRGKALRLLQPFPVKGEVYLTIEDLQTSLQAPLILQGLGDVVSRLQPLKPSPQEDPVTLPCLSAVTHLALGHNWLALTWGKAELSAHQLRLETAMVLRDQRWLYLHQPLVSRYVDNAWCDPIPMETVAFDLGSETQIDQFVITPDHIQIRGTVRVIPATP